MLTYRSFTTPKVFLDLLIKRFTIDPPQDLGSQAKLDDWKRQVQTPVRLRVFNVIKTWISNYYHDFEHVRLLGCLNILSALILLAPRMTLCLPS